jgi:hypothetical protein
MRPKLWAVPVGLILAAAATAAPGPGYHARVAVSGPTRLDWTFALSNRSLVTPPKDFLPADFDSTRQSYELFVPPQAEQKKPLPLVLFVSPGDGPAGWKQFEAPCKQLGAVFVSPHGAGNNVPMPKRVRIVLDVLDDVRRQFPIDPDRSYVGGFSGGGRVACAIAFALPEHFGGAIPACASGDVREESWLRRRVADRLSVALLTGEKDFNRGECERLRGPYLRDVGVRTRVWVQPGLGHGVPDAKVIGEALAWLEEGLPKRRELAQKYPASRAGEAAGREEQAKALLAESKQRLGDKDLYNGLMQAQGVFQRWPDLAAGEEAKKVLLDYEGKKEKPWEADDVAEQRRFLIARARALDAYASGDLPPQYLKQRPDMLKQAVELWKMVVADGQDAAAVEQAKKRLPVLEKLAAEK